MKNLKLLLFLVILLVSCKKLCKPQGFTLVRKDVSTQLKLHGFYYGDFDTSSTDEVNVSLIVLYQNGIIITSGSGYDRMEKYLADLISSNSLKSKRDAWGLYKGEGNTITIENNISRQCGKWVENRKGEIIDDSTFILTQRELHTENGVESSTINQVFRFRAYAPKPDSTNDFIQ